MYCVKMRLDGEIYEYGKYETKERAEEVRAFVEDQRGIEVFVEEE